MTAPTIVAWALPACLLDVADKVYQAAADRVKNSFEKLCPST